MQAVAVIPVRLGATRFPNKPLHPLLGKPMVQWVWEAARAAGCFDRVLVAAEEEELAQRARAFGAEAVCTGPCVSGSDRVAAAVATLSADFVVNVQGDEPLLEPAALRRLLTRLQGTPWAQIGTLVTASSSAAEYQNPNIVKAALGEEGRALYFSRAPIGRTPGGKFWKHVGIYAYRRAALEHFVTSPKNGLEEDERLEQLRALAHGAAFVAEETTATVAVDTPDDAVAAEAALRRRLAAFAPPTTEATIPR